jgi:N-methylhydantoinase A
MSKGWQVGIDVGGTFTDVIALDPGSGEIRSAKVDTRIDDRVKGLLAALDAVGLAWTDVDDLIHGTTMVTNAIVEDDLDDVALVATEGFSDTIEIGRQNRRYLYRLDLDPKVKPQVQADRRFELSERLDHAGHVVRPLDAASLDRVIDKVVKSGAKAVAVSLLHSYANAEHEEQLGARLREKIPYVALSSRVNPEAREYERMATTVLSASVMPLAAGYLDRLESVKPAGSRLHLFHSAGGMASPAALRELPLSLAMSGPAAGVAAACLVARQLDLQHAISFDMGGTTTDVCLIVDGQAQISSDRSLGDRPIRQPMIAVDSIGAGGGSIARLDHGALLVGPESAGSMPGPACYGRGGTLATVSDANLVLGYLDAGRPLGSGLKLHLTRARAAISELSGSMGMSVEAAALGIVRVANSAMVRALRRTTVERGVDGRHCALLAFGGAGPMHAVEVARSFGISKVVVPAHSGAFSALGCAGAEMSYSQQRTVRMAARAWDGERLERIRAALREHLREPLRAAGHKDADIVLQEVAAVRYVGQSYAIEVYDPPLDDPSELGNRFFALHERLYGFATDEPWQLETLRMRAFVPRPGHLNGGGDGNVTSPVPVKTASCWFEAGEAVATPRYDRTVLGAGAVINGPAIIEDACSTIVIPPGAAAAADSHGHLLIDVRVAP